MTVTVLSCVEVVGTISVEMVYTVLVTIAAGWSSVFVVTVLAVWRIVDVEGASVAVFVLVQKGMVRVFVFTSFWIFTQFTACG